MYGGHRGRVDDTVVGSWDRYHIQSCVFEDNGGMGHAHRVVKLVFKKSIVISSIFFSYK